MLLIQQENEYTGNANYSNKLHWFQSSKPTPPPPTGESFEFNSLEQVPDNFGELALTKANNFADDATSIFTVTNDGNDLFVSYRTATAAKVAKCKMTFTVDNKVAINDPADCVAYSLPDAKSPTFVSTFKNGADVFSHLFYKSGNTFTLSTCKINTDTKVMDTCVSTTKTIDIFGEKFLRFEKDAISNVRILFSKSDAETVVKTASTIVFNLRPATDGLSLNFDYV